MEWLIFLPIALIIFLICFCKRGNMEKVKIYWNALLKEDANTSYDNSSEII